MPRFTFEKFAGAEALLTTSMKSVGEAMAIGRTLPEACKRRCVDGNRADGLNESRSTADGRTR